MKKIVIIIIIVFAVFMFSGNDSKEENKQENKSKKTQIKFLRKPRKKPPELNFEPSITLKVEELGGEFQVYHSGTKETEYSCICFKNDNGEKNILIEYMKKFYNSHKSKIKTVKWNTLHYNYNNFYDINWNEKEKQLEFCLQVDLYIQSKYRNKPVGDYELYPDFYAIRYKKNTPENIIKIEKPEWYIKKYNSPKLSSFEVATLISKLKPVDELRLLWKDIHPRRSYKKIGNTMVPMFKEVSEEEVHNAKEEVNKAKKILLQLRTLLVPGKNINQFLRLIDKGRLRKIDKGYSLYLGSFFVFPRSEGIGPFDFNLIYDENGKIIEIKKQIWKR